MPSYGRCKIEYVYMLMFLFVITETNCISHKYDEPRHTLINGDVAVYQQQGKSVRSLMKYGNKIVQKMKGKVIASGENLVPMRANVTQERIVRASVSSTNLSEVSYPKKWKTGNCERSVVCKGSEEAWSLSPQLVALVATVCATVMCATITSVALVYMRRTWHCRHCQANATATATAAAAGAAAPAVGRPGARSRSRRTPECKRRWARDPTPYPSLESTGSPDAAAGDAAVLRAALSDTFSDMLLSSPSSTSTTPSQLNMVDEELPAVHTEPPANGTIVRLPASFHFRPQFRTRTHGPAA